LLFALLSAANVPLHRPAFLPFNRSGYPALLALTLLADGMLLPLVVLRAFPADERLLLTEHFYQRLLAWVAYNGLFWGSMFASRITTF